MSTLPCYKLVLHKTYYDKGFFNLGVAVDRYIRSDSGPITIRLGESKFGIEGKVDRNANLNGTPRIFGGSALRNWFFKHFQLKDVVEVRIVSSTEVWLQL